MTTVQLEVDGPAGSNKLVDKGTDKKRLNKQSEGLLYKSTERTNRPQRPSFRCSCMERSFVVRYAVLVGSQ